MEKLKLKQKDAIRAIKTLEEILLKEYNIIIRDASIQRFEYTFEAVWKFSREYLKEKEGIIVNSPKTCFRELFSIGILSEEKTVLFLEMTDRRNETSHTYKEEVADIIYKSLTLYAQNLKSLLNQLN